MNRITFAFGGLIALIAAAAAAQEHEHGATANGQLGTVAFATSCHAAAAPHVNRGVALLHSFEFGRAAAAFTSALGADPACAMAEWGIAMTAWGNPFGVGIRPPAPLQQGRDAVERARRLAPNTARERAYIDAAAHLYERADTIEQRTRLLAYRDAMAAVASAYPADSEAAIFHALSMSAAAAASPLDSSYAEPLKAGAILERLILTQPDHPGLAHYIIHSYDYPALADRALEAARRYAAIAPDSPHARHMPSHTFTRVGYWQESIDANVASGAVARRDGMVGEELHSMDYRTYAYLQTAQDAGARAMVDALPDVAGRFDPNGPASAAPNSAAFFAMAAIPARYALERGAWAEAAALQPRATSYPYTEALTYFARAIGAAHTGNTAVITASIDALQRITETLTAQRETYWAEQTAIQRREASAWLALAEGRRADAVAAMRAAAQMEDGTEKAAVTPGPLAPARELLGEMLLQLDQPAEALKEFEATLNKEPNRFRAMNGAARAATRSGDRVKARAYYTQLLKICERADAPGRPELSEARAATALR
ncbi:MAG: repeat-containing protein [Acidobacteria bacterium]|nr:repeat-containing protein [Acidobacteriota bacterium]